MTELEHKIAAARKVILYYDQPHKYKFAIVKYTCRKGQPFKVASYYTYGEELKTGEKLICWSWLPSTNFVVLEQDFNTEAEAVARMKELRRLRNEANT